MVWELCVRVGGVSERTLAAPSQIVASMIRTWPDLMAAAAVTTVEAVAGFLIAVAAGVIIGIGLHLSKTLDRAVSPLLVAAQTIPLITIAPLFVIWFGFEPFARSCWWRCWGCSRSPCRPRADSTPCRGSTRTWH